MYEKEALTMLLEKIEGELTLIKDQIEDLVHFFQNSWLPGQKVEFAYDTWDGILLRTTTRKEVGEYLGIAYYPGGTDTLVKTETGSIISMPYGKVKFLKKDEVELQIKNLEQQVEELRELLYPHVS